MQRLGLWALLFYCSNDGQLTTVPTNIYYTSLAAFRQPEGVHV